MAETKAATKVRALLLELLAPQGLSITPGTDFLDSQDPGQPGDRPATSSLTLTSKVGSPLLCGSGGSKVLTTAH